MPTVQTPLEVLSAHVQMVTLGMEEFVMVCRNTIFVHVLIYLNVDIDECLANEQYPCHAKANCVNLIGSYFCTCFVGYNGDGKDCKGKALTHKVYIYSGYIM